MTMLWPAVTLCGADEQMTYTTRGTQWLYEMLNIFKVSFRYFCSAVALTTVSQLPNCICIYAKMTVRIYRILQHTLWVP
jgi:hypothetical protein